MKKKWIALFLSGVLAASLCACGGEQETQTGTVAADEAAWSVYCISAEAIWSPAEDSPPAIWQS